MCQTKSVKKVLNFLEVNKKATPTELVNKCRLNYGTVNNSIDFLKELDKIKIVSSGSFRIIQIKEQRENEHDFRYTD